MKYLVVSGCKLTENGYICLSKKRKNHVTSNVLGAASYHGNDQVLKYLMSALNVLNINFTAIEKTDINQKGSLQKEFHGYTPLMLAVAGGDQNLECVRCLLSNKANTSITDSFGNTLLHIAAIYGSNDILRYLIQNLKQINIFERNNNGETALSIA